MKRIKGDARGELATGPFYDPGNCLGCGAGWSDRKEQPGPGDENYYGRHPSYGSRGDDEPASGRRLANRLGFRSISGKY